MAALVIWFAMGVIRRGAAGDVARTAWIAIGLGAVQIAVGFASVYTILGVVPVSLHTLLAASLLALCGLMATRLGCG